MSEFGVEELDWPAQSPDLNPIEDLWDELEWRLRARPSHPTSVSDLTNALLEECTCWLGASVVISVMGKYFCNETDIRSAWEHVLSAFWQRYPNPYSTHVLTEDVVFREVTPDNCLLSRRLLTKTNRLPRWAERIFPGNLSRSVYIVEDSIVDPNNRRLTTLTWNLNHSKLMMVVERCVFHGERERPVWTRLTREAWISSGVFGLSRPIQEFGLSRFRSNQMKAMKGLEHALSKLHISAAQSHHCDTPKDSSEKAKNMTSPSSSQKPQEYV